MPSLVIVSLIAAWALIQGLVRDRHGRRAASPLAMVAAIVMLVGSVTGAARVIVPMVRNLAASAPRTRDSSLSALVERLAATEDEASARPLLVEIRQQLGAGAFRSSERDGLLELLDARMTGATTVAIAPEWTALVMLAWEEGWLPEDDRGRRLAGTVAQVELDGLRPMNAGDVTLATTVLRTAGGSQLDLAFDVTIDAVQWNGAPLARTAGTGRTHGVASARGIARTGGLNIYRDPRGDPLEPGRSAATVDLGVAMTVGGTTRTWSERRVVEAEVLARPAAWMQPVDDHLTGVAVFDASSLTDGIRGSTSREVILTREDGHPVLRGTLKFEPVPVALDGSILVRVGNREIVGSTGVRVVPDDDLPIRYGFRAPLDTPPTGTVDVIFRPAPVAANWRDLFYERGTIPVWTVALEWLDVPVRADPAEPADGSLPAEDP